jgi:hypothetical protein
MNFSACAIFAANTSGFIPAKSSRPGARSIRGTLSDIGIALGFDTSEEFLGTANEKQDETRITKRYAAAYRML